jgi:hypothetical protein
VATTTPKTIRNTVAGLIEDITPAIHSGQDFKRYRQQKPGFRAWALANPTQCLRRFSVAFLRDVQPPAVNDTLVQEVSDTLEIVVAYPNDGRHNTANAEEMDGLEDVILSDQRLIEADVGPPGYATFAGLVAPACVIKDQPETTEGEPDDPVWFGVIRYRVDYWRSLS